MLPCEPVNEKVDTAAGPIPVLWLRCPACGGIAGFRAVGDGRLVGACFADTKCWWAGEFEHLAGEPSRDRRDADRPG